MPLALALSRWSTIAHAPLPAALAVMAAAAMATGFSNGASPTGSSALPAAARTVVPAELEVPVALLPGGRHLTLTDLAMNGSGSLLRTSTPSVDDTGHAAGRRLLELDWRSEPALAPLIGPGFDRTSCGDCHAEARVPTGNAHDEPVRIARPVEGAHGVPQYTRYTDDSGVESRRLALDFVRRPRRFDDGRPYELRSVVATLADGGRDIGPDRLALRVAPALFGWGLLERVAPAALARMADPADRNGDGISGRMTVAEGRLGRFGWKATQPSLRRQSAAALYHDMGVTTDEFRDVACASAPDGRCRVELPGPELDALVAYVAALGVPDRRDRQAEPVRREARLFSRIGCADCHVPVLTVENRAALVAFLGSL